MNVDDVQKLKFDRRMERRRGWLAPGELQAHLEGLADAESKVHEPTEEELAAAAGADETVDTGATPA